MPKPALQQLVRSVEGPLLDTLLATTLQTLLSEVMRNVSILHGCEGLLNQTTQRDTLARSREDEKQLILWLAGSPRPQHHSRSRAGVSFTAHQCFPPTSISALLQHFSLLLRLRLLPTLYEKLFEPEGKSYWHRAKHASRGRIDVEYG